MHPSMRVGKSEIIYSSVGQGSAARCCSRRVAVEAQAVQSLQREKDWVFAALRRAGKQPYWPDALWKRYGRNAVTKGGISKRVGFIRFAILTHRCSRKTTRT